VYVRVFVSVGDGGWEKLISVFVCVCILLHEQAFVFFLYNSHVVKEEDGSTSLRIVS